MSKAIPFTKRELQYVLYEVEVEGIKTAAAVHITNTSQSPMV